MSLRLPLRHLRVSLCLRSLAPPLARSQRSFASSSSSSESPEPLPENFWQNQHVPIDASLKEQLRALIWQFRAPIRYAVAYGSGVFSQGTSPTSQPMIDLLFGVTHTQHWHSLNLAQNRKHYSFLGSLGSAAVSFTQDSLGAGVYFNPYVTMGGISVKYGVVNIDTLCRDLTDWDSLYLAGRMHKPVKILRDDPRVRLANHKNLLSAVRAALLLLPEKFNEKELFLKIAGISYMGDPRMALPTENPHKVANIVTGNFANFQRLYYPLIDQLPNVSFTASSEKTSGSDEAGLAQDMDPLKRGNMVRRLPVTFRKRLYTQYYRKLNIPVDEFRKIMNVGEEEERMLQKQGGEFERMIAADADGIRGEVSSAIRGTSKWVNTSQSLKGVLTAGPVRSARYLGEKMRKWGQSQKSAIAGGKEKEKEKE